MRYTTEGVVRVLTRLGIPTDRVEDAGDKGEEVYAPCPGHRARMDRDDHNASWSVNSETGMHNCWSCGFKGNLIGLTLEVLDLKTSWGLADYEGAEKFVAEAVGLSIEDVRSLANSLGEAWVSLPTPVAMTEARLAVFQDPPEWALEARGLAPEAAAFHRVRWDGNHNHWITPVRYSDSHRLMGWQAKGEGTRYFKNLPPNVRKSRTLFGLDVWQQGQMIVVESPLDVVRITSAGIKGAVSTYGAKISDEQIRLMRQADDLIVAFDNPHTDKAGGQAFERMLQASRDGLIEPRFFAYGQYGAKDPGDMTDAEIFHGVEHAKHCVHGRKAFV